MSRACDVVFLGAATSFPSGGRPGNILVGQSGAIDGAVAIVADDGSAVAIEATPYVPTNDNGTDLGSAVAQFRTLYLGTSISNGFGALTIDVPGGGTTAVSITNSGAGVCTLTVDGIITGTGGLATGASGTVSFFGGTARAQLGAIADPAGGGTVDAECRTAVAAILARLRGAAGFNLIAT